MPRCIVLLLYLAILGVVTISVTFCVGSVVIVMRKKKTFLNCGCKMMLVIYNWLIASYFRENKQSSVSSHRVLVRQFEVNMLFY